MRLFDAKREIIRPGDQIEFLLAGSDDESFCVTVENIDQYKSFEELIQSYSRDELGCSNEESDATVLKGIHKIFSRDQEKLAGVVAIRFKL